MTKSEKKVFFSYIYVAKKMTGFSGYNTQEKETKKMSETKSSAKGAKIKNLLVKGSTAASMIATAMLMSPAVFADTDATSKMKQLLTTIIPYLAAIGIPIAFMGGFKLIMAFRNDQGDAVPAAARDLAIGIVITLFATIGPAILNSL